MLKQVSDASPACNLLSKFNQQSIIQEGNEQAESIPIRNNNGKTDFDQIIEFIKGMRMQVEDDTGGQHARIGQVEQDGEFEEQVGKGKRKANRLVVEAEKFRASVNAPPGTLAQGNNNVLVNDPEPMVQLQQNGVNSHIGMNQIGDMDDEFFPVTCHVDSQLHDKIERGEFVELEKLLPKMKCAVTENRLDLVFRDGHLYFIPAQSDSRINGIRCWEQAFRIYAAIYSKANPSRSAEIWQYVHVINMAAASYTWENVANYDFTFRQLMHQYPQRSWAKLYLQMWSISMRDPIHKMYNQQSGQNGVNVSVSNSGAKFNQNSAPANNVNVNNKSGPMGHAKKKPNYCWAFNKGTCTFRAKCKFVNQCSYCDSVDHGIHSCPKADKSKLN